MKFFNLFKNDDDNGSNNDKYSVCQDHGHNYRDATPQGYTGSIEKIHHPFFSNIGCDLVIRVDIERKEKKPCRDCRKVIESKSHVTKIYVCRDKESKDLLYLEKDEVDKLYEKDQEE